MARIDAEELERLKRDTDLVELVGRGGLVLKPQGTDFVGRCPFHEGDETPSLHITPDKGLFHCFGCGAGGSAIDWVQRSSGVSFRHAVEILRQKTPLPTSRTVRVLPLPVRPDADDQVLLDDVNAYYHQTLKESAEPLDYLEERGLRNDALISHFKLGFSNRTLGLRIPEKQVHAGGELRARLHKLGVIKESGHEFFRGSLTVPIFDDAGHVVGMYGRKVTKGLRPGTPLHLYLPGPHRGVFNGAGIKGCKEVILCEALIDAMTFWVHGFRNVTSSYGVEGFTEDMLQAFKTGGVEKVLIAYDRDDAGDRAAEALGARLLVEGFEVLRVQFPHDMDANEFAQKHQPADRMLGMLLNGAKWLGRGPSTAAPMPAAVDVKDEVAEPAPAEVPPAEPQAAPAPTPPPQAALPPSTPAALHASCEKRGADLVFTKGDRSYRVAGFSRNTSHEVMKLTITARRAAHFHVDSLDMLVAPARFRFIRQTAQELGVNDDVIKNDVGEMLLHLEQMQDARIQDAQKTGTQEVELSDAEKEEALKLLKDPRLLFRIVEDFERFGVVGEELNKLTGYVAATSRLLEKPLAVLIRNTSGAGKSSLMEAILSFMPEEAVEKFSAMTEQALYYMGETNLCHRILALAEEEGAQRASYPLKMLQSEGELKIASTTKDPQSGALSTKNYLVRGPVAIFETTTSLEMDEELLNRCIEVEIDEGREQTRAIHRMQRHQQTREWINGKEARDQLRAVHQNAQRLLKGVSVYNPFEKFLTFPDDRTRLRRDNAKYIALINAVALLHQYQRKRVDKDTIEVTLDDIAVANRLAHATLGRSLDELPPQTRRLLNLIDTMVTSECERLGIERQDLRFSQRDVRDFSGLGQTQLKLHMARLADFEFLVAHRGARGMSVAYELAYDGGGADGAPVFSGLVDVKTLAARLGMADGQAYDNKWSGLGRPQVGPRSGGGRPPVGSASLRPNAEKADSGAKRAEKARIPPNGHGSYTDDIIGEE